MNAVECKHLREEMEKKADPRLAEVDRLVQEVTGKASRSK